ncbi:MAG: adenylate/guanylate cyclase domain-containing protein [Thermosynechococcaceae cyanobacterium]
MNFSLGLLKSRLSRRIVSSVFFCIVAIEGVLFIPAYAQRERELLLQLETVSAEVLTTIKVDVMTDVVSSALLDRAQERLKPDSVIVGGTLFSPDGKTLDTFGDAPTIPVAEVLGDQVIRLRTGDRYDIAWPQRMFQDQYILVIRHDASQIQQSLLLFTARTVAVVILLSACVTLLMIWILERLLITPIVELRKDLMLAGEGIGNDQAPQFTNQSLHRPDELGDVAVAFHQMFHRVKLEISDRKQAELALRVEKEKSEKLLLNILPAAIANKLKEDPGAIASRCQEATILFADIVDFTSLSTQVSPGQLVKQLNAIFSAFDFLTEQYGLEKIKTIGDAYMVAGGVTINRGDHVETVLEMALEMQEAIRKFRRPDGRPFELRIGVNTGPVIAGVIGLHKFSYDLWGDAVNIASRMESHGIINQIHVTESTYARVQGKYHFTTRGPVQLKGWGTMNAYLLMGRRSSTPAAVPRNGRQPNYDVAQVHVLTTNLLAEVTQASVISNPLTGKRTPG